MQHAQDYLSDRNLDGSSKTPSEIDEMKIPEIEKQILQSPPNELRLTSMAKRNSGSGSKKQRKMTMYRPRTPGTCKKGYRYDSKLRMCVRAK
jgi:hypothetical protein